MTDQRPRSRRQYIDGFTLVELLVVIGIIAVLVAILIPVLGAARRQANTAKCLSNLRSIGQSLNAYALDNKQFWPIVQHYDNAATPPCDQRWSMMLLRYLTSPGEADAFSITYGPGNASQLTITAGPGLSAYKDTALFCPESAEFKDNVGFTVSAVQSGYGMQQMPLNSLTFPALGMSNAAYEGLENGRYIALIRPAANRKGRYFKASEWGRSGAERIIIADSRSYFLDARPYPGADQVKPQTPGFQGDLAGNDTQADRYRHGVRNANLATNTTTGKVAFNALYCDGHAETLTDIERLFLGVRMRLKEQ
jgi:prepilin-type N-terminal cleavage/methylation domain-containing protein/prepilin-type processing-associated H-X9-DG protein